MSMDSERLAELNEIEYRISVTKKQIKGIESYSGNKWFIGYGQDKAHCTSLSVNEEEFDLIMGFILRYKKAKLEGLKKEFKEA